MPVIASEPKPAFSAAFEKEISDGVIVDRNGKDRTGGQTDPGYADLEFDPAAVQFKFRIAAGQNAV